MHKERSFFFATRPIKLFLAQTHEGHMLLRELDLIMSFEELSMIYKPN
jgi:hypothetical protein